MMILLHTTEYIHTVKKHDILVKYKKYLEAFVPRFKEGLCLLIAISVVLSFIKMLSGSLVEFTFQYLVLLVESVSSLMSRPANADQ